MKGYRLQVIGFSLIFLLFTVTCTLYPTYAVDSTPSANIQSKLDELKKEIASKAAKIKKEVNQKLQNKAYVGVIKTKSDNSLTVAAKSGSKIINVNQDTIYQGTTTTTLTDKKKTTKKTAVSFNVLKEEDFIVAQGDIDESGVLTAKRIVLLPAMDQEQHTTPLGFKTHLWGEVVSVSDRLLTVKNKTGENKTVSILGEASFKKGIEDAALSDLKKGLYIIASGSLKNDETLSAEYIYIIPLGGQIKPASPKTASPSATTKSSAKPTPKPTPKAS